MELRDKKQLVNWSVNIVCLTNTGTLIILFCNKTFQLSDTVLIALIIANSVTTIGTTFLVARALSSPD